MLVSEAKAKELGNELLGLQTEQSVLDLTEHSRLGTKSCLVPCLFEIRILIS